MSNVGGLMSVCVQRGEVESVKFAVTVGCHGLACASLRGVSQVLHAVFGWLQSIPQRFVSAACRAWLVSRMDALLFVPIAFHSQPVDIGRTSTF